MGRKEYGEQLDLHLPFSIFLARIVDVVAGTALRLFRPTDYRQWAD
jgi:hypothetical protein